MNREAIKEIETVKSNLKYYFETKGMNFVKYEVIEDLTRMYFAKNTDYLYRKQK